ncbi:NUDIX hydrolase [Chitinophaga sp. Cy-1792]|uniref:NUDIX hydrolase n=1 Tax=Chitinophaga sp. Cy-1792 TaxID=2608339 RepID=UPI0014209609|nr:NUDIX hydrolase [Chitinophaga sp. Cy-1792]NIG57522.1 NUDIX hydrolase [Chitinophaga sp. Cy-1792]
MKKYSQQTRILLAVDCIIFGFDGQELKVLLIKRGFEPFKGQWSLLGGFVQANESAEDAAARQLKALSGLDGVYMEQLHIFSDPNRDTVERTVSVAFTALIDIKKYKAQIHDDFHAEWFPLNQHPELIFDHQTMVNKAKDLLRYKATLQPILLELMPVRFTLTQLQCLYESVFDQQFDKGNFSRKLLSTALLVKLTDKDKLNSKKGAFYYRIDKKNYKRAMMASQLPGM